MLYKSFIYYIERNNLSLAVARHIVYFDFWLCEVNLGLRVLLISENNGQPVLCIWTLRYNIEVKHSNKKYVYLILIANIKIYLDFNYNLTFPHSIACCRL